jgi:hypothetical protein
VEGSHLYKPTVTIGQVILPEEQKEMIVNTVLNFEKFQKAKKKLGFDDIVSYGNGMVMLVWQFFLSFVFRFCYSLPIKSNKYSSLFLLFTPFFVVFRKVWNRKDYDGERVGEHAPKTSSSYQLPLFGLYDLRYYYQIYFQRV